jgi:hypothetical protein
MNTRREYIWKLLKTKPGGMTCQELTNRIAVSEGIEGSRYLSGSISSLLNRMVKKGELKYSVTKQGPKGGHVYVSGL